MEDDLTIEDEFSSNEEVLSNVQIKRNFLSQNIFQIFNEQWILFAFFSITFFICLLIYQKRRRNDNSRVTHSLTEDDHSCRYEQIEHIRQRQQKAYEEQAARYAQQVKSKIENLKINEDEKAKPLKYRKSDHNSLMGQAQSGSSNSCSWRPSSRRKPQNG